MSSAQSQAIDLLASMVAGSSTLQERAGMDETEVRERIYLPGKTFDPMEGESPVFPTVAILLPPEGTCSYTKYAEGDRDQFTIQGTCILEVWDSHRHADDWAGGYMDFLEFSGLVLEETMTLSSFDNNLTIESAEPLIGPLMLDSSVPQGRLFYLQSHAINWSGLLRFSE